MKPVRRRPAESRPPRASAAPGRSPARHRRAEEEKFHGLRACEALFARRPGDIVRVYVTARRKPTFAKLLEHCVRERKGFQIVEDENLERLTGSLHHEGIAILAKAIVRQDLAGLVHGIEKGTITGPLLYLDGVQNPHNLGSILRTAAHFGVGAVVGAEGQLPPLSAAAVRVAEGAAEHVPVVALAAPGPDLARLKKAGYELVATTSHGGEPLWAASLAPAERLVIVMGSEGEGMSRAVERACDRTVRIPGTGVVESLNVAVACGIVLADVRRRV
ncbi:MAG: RNA methyltransferase [Planctomycetia bacterium]|nr:RNA methyltransferase [Planctomycetia bacterium]